MTSIVTSLLLSALVARSLAAPLQGRIVNIATRGRTFNSSGIDDENSIFDPTYPRREMQGLLNKYEAALEFLDAKDIPSVAATILKNFKMTKAVESALDAAYAGDGGVQSAQQAQLQMPLTDYRTGNLDLLYYGPLQIGSSGQRLTFDVDTGSADLWMPVDCNDCQGTGYNSGGSTTYKPTKVPFSVAYGSGSVSGTLAQDRVTMGSLSVDNQYFGAVNQESADFQDSPNDGLIGMAFSSIASSSKTTFFENLIIGKKIPAAMFSVYFTRGQPSGSQVCFGCYDSTKAKGAISWVALSSQTYWAVPMPNAFINGNAVVGLPSGITAAIDTGTTLIYFPKAAADAFYDMIPESASADQYGQGFYTYPCTLR